MRAIARGRIAHKANGPLASR